MQREAGTAADVDENSLRALDGIVFEKRTSDGAVGSIGGAVRTGGDGGAHDGISLTTHDGFYVSEIAIDNARHSNDVRDALDGLAQNIVGDAEGVEETGAAFDRFHQPLVGNYDYRVNGANQILQSLFGLQHTTFAFECKRLGNDRHGESHEFARERTRGSHRGGRYQAVCIRRQTSYVASRTSSAGFDWRR